MSVLPHYERMLREYKCCSPKESVLRKKGSSKRGLLETHLAGVEAYLKS
jgi:hypothetical protein